MVDAAYLSWLHLTGGNALCTTGSGCDVVQHSVYSELAGIPIALFGLAGFLGILLIQLLESRLPDWHLTLTLAITLAGTLYSAYLTYLELFVLHAICPYCVASALLMVGLLVVAIVRYQSFTSHNVPEA